LQGSFALDANRTLSSHSLAVAFVVERITKKPWFRFVELHQISG
jgi:hypothetical protein